MSISPERVLERGRRFLGRIWRNFTTPSNPIAELASNPNFYLDWINIGLRDILDEHGIDLGGSMFVGLGTDEGQRFVLKGTTVGRRSNPCVPILLYRLGNNYPLVLPDTYTDYQDLISLPDTHEEVGLLDLTGLKRLDELIAENSHIYSYQPSADFLKRRKIQELVSVLNVLEEQKREEFEATYEGAYNEEYGSPKELTEKKLWAVLENNGAYVDGLEVAAIGSPEKPEAFVFATASKGGIDKANGMEIYFMNYESASVDFVLGLAMAEDSPRKLRALTVDEVLDLHSLVGRTTIWPVRKFVERYKHKQREAFFRFK